MEGGGPTPNPFKAFEGRLVRVVFRDGGEIQAKKGRLVFAEGDFITLRTLVRTYVIRVSEVLKLQDAGRGEP
jgi:ribosome maturation factor RimP